MRAGNPMVGVRVPTSTAVGPQQVTGPLSAVVAEEGTLTHRVREGSGSLPGLSILLVEWAACCLWSLQEL